MSRVTLYNIHITYNVVVILSGVGCILPLWKIPSYSVHIYRFTFVYYFLFFSSFLFLFSGLSIWHILVAVKRRCLRRMRAHKKCHRGENKLWYNKTPEANRSLTVFTYFSFFIFQPPLSSSLYIHLHYIYFLNFLIITVLCLFLLMLRVTYPKNNERYDKINAWENALNIILLYSNLFHYILKFL